MKVTAIIRSLLMVLVAGCAHLTTCSSSLYANETDRLPLLEFKKGISLDPQQALMSWNDSTHFCNWEGVHCSMKNPRRVTSLKLINRGLVGHISHSLGNLTFLKHLILVENTFTSEIPPSLGHLHRLQYLFLSNNTLQGGIPSFANCSSLKVLALNGNNLVGQIPADWPPNLQKMSLSANNLAGTIPTSLTNLTMLNDFRCMYNKIEGDIPNEFAKFRMLQVLYVGMNRLAELNKLEAHNNQDWEFMYSLANCTKLRDFSIYANRLEGHVPASLGNLSVHLEILFLGRNKLSGSFPCGIKNFPKLIRLSLHNNQFTGVVPEWLGSLRNLQAIWLYDNMFTGFIPMSLSNLSRLGVLNLGSNNFSGHIPASLGSLQMLGELDMPNNNFHGRVPKEIFTIPTIMEVDLSSNNLDGQLPSNIGNAKQLSYLDVSSNKLSGDIPHTLGNCRSLQQILLDMNTFSGSMPTSFGDLTDLKVLNLSYNALTGSIPASLGDLQLLQEIDLSFNHLEGEAPTKGIFKNVTVVWIDGNQGLCGGTSELRLPACSIAPLGSAKHKQSIVLKAVIPVAIAVLIVVVIYVLLFRRGRQMKKHIPLLSFGMEFPKISYTDLAIATEGFSASNLIGRGSYSSVYQGRLFQDGNVVAVKVFSMETRGAQNSFILECDALRNLRHRNIVRILTACSSIDYRGNDFKALVYEFMPRGDLHKLLHSGRDDESSSDLNCISLAERLSIAADVADALEYLHHNNQGTLVHCDLKPSNILLDDNMTAHVGDFGLARFKVDSMVPSSGDSHSTCSVAIKGTIGYVAPECATGGYASTAGDVYSFGIVLLEIFLRKRPTDDMFKDGLNIANFVEMNFPDGILQIVDPELLRDQLDLPQETPAATKENVSHCLLSVFNIGLCCTQSVPNERMDMQEVAARLHRIKDTYLKRN